MVFFNQERVEQAQSMVGAAAAEYRVFQRGTQPGSVLRVSSSWVLVPASRST